jgi:hypothetical protein
MTPSAARGARSPEARRALLLAAVFAIGPAVAPSPARALDTTLDVRDTRQTARTDDRTFRSSFRRELVSLRQPREILEGLDFDARFRFSRETTGSDVSGADLETERRTYQPGLALIHKTRITHLGLNANWLERRTTGTTGFSPESSRRQFGAWLNVEPAPRTRIQSSLERTITEERGEIEGDSESRQTSGYIHADRYFAETWQFQYRFGGLGDDLVTRDTRRTQFSHGLDLRGSPSFEDGRVDTNFRLFSQFLDQHTETGSIGGATVLLPPVRGGVILDDTPETLDPLEDGITLVPGLSDRDRTTATSINLGDSAPVVREFGGDYRNLQYDFGEVREFSSAILLVDARLPNPELFAWRVFVTEDPEGRLWDELPPGEATVTWREWSDLLRGWEVAFAPGIRGRYVKLVNVKLGTTIPDLFVTEMEVYVQEPGEVLERDTNTQSHRVEAGVGYDVSPEVRVSYQGDYGRRNFDQSERNQNEWGHALTTRWTRDDYRVIARYERNTLSSELRTNTDLSSYQLSATRGQATRSSVTAAWNRTEDNSSGLDRSTDTYTVQGNWRPLRRFRFTTRLSHGRRRDEVLDTRARSWTVTNSLRTSPFPRLSIDFDRTDRWVNREAGAGFERFNDTVLNLGWSPVPLVTLSSNVRYQVRQTSEWNSTQSISWSPFPGGLVETQFTGNSYYDSRTHVWRLGVGSLVRWRPRPRLLVEGSVQAQRYELRDTDNRPVSTQIHASWSF